MRNPLRNNVWLVVKLSLLFYSSDGATILKTTRMFDSCIISSLCLYELSL